MLNEKPQNRPKGRVSRRNNPPRCGAAVAELAVLLPIMTLIAMATIETCSMIYLRQGLRVAAYEGARIALIQGTTEANVLAGCHQILQDRRITASNVTITPSNFSLADYGTAIRVNVTADCGTNSLFPPWIFSGRQISSDIQVMSER
jgi:Flp pilus assembly protein TadG